MLSYKFKKAISIIKKEGYSGLLRVLKKITGDHDNLIKTMEAFNLIEALDFTVDEYENNRLLMERFERVRPALKSINWFIPFFLHPYYGGIYTIFRFAYYFSREKGIRTRLIIYDNPYVTENEVKSSIKNAFPELAKEEVYIYRGPHVNVIPYADVTVATLWTSAYQVMKFKNTLGKFYFIQDYEPLFYPAGSYYAMAEATYRFGFYGIVNTPGLFDFIRNNYRIKAEYFVPAVDKGVFFPRKDFLEAERKPKKIFVYGRPQHERNAFELALLTARKLKAKFGDNIDIVSAGSEWDPKDYGLEGVIKNLGLLGYKETAELYRTSDYGLVFMFTKHPSYIPLELMASGTIVITNHNHANAWLLKNMENCIIVEPSPSYITEKISALMADKKLQMNIRQNALKTAFSIEWEPQMEKIYRFITGKF